MRLLLDTNRYTDLAKGDEVVLRLVREAEEVHVPFVVLAELRAGFLHGTRGSANEGALARFVASPRVTVDYADDETCHQYARLYAQLRRQGTPVPTNDLWIAALATQHGLFLCSRDPHFAYLPQLLRAG